MTEVDAEAVLRWVDAYERAWRERDVALLGELFPPDVIYLTEPYATPLVGLDAIANFWLDESEPDEVFSMTSEVVVAGDTSVVRVHVRYGEPLRQEYLNLWVLAFDDEGRVARFEEWPFWPTHGRAPVRPAATVVSTADLEAMPYAEWVRSSDLSAGVYRLPAGSVDEQSPHAEDEVYVVLAGAADLEVDAARTPMRPGSAAYVPRGVTHRFVDIAADLEVAVVFAPPENAEA